MNNKKINTLITVILVAVFCLVIFGITYAFFTMFRGTNIINNAATSGKLEVVYTNGQDINGYIYPAVDNSTALTTTATVRKTSTSVEGYATINLNVTAIDPAFATNAFKWEVYDDVESSPINYGNFNGITGNSVIKLVEDHELTTVDTTFTVKIWLDGELCDTHVENKNFSAYIDVTAVNVPANVSAG